jgi:hypothetical protein
MANSKRSKNCSCAAPTGHSRTTSGNVALCSKAYPRTAPRVQEDAEAMGSSARLARAVRGNCAAPIELQHAGRCPAWVERHLPPMGSPELGCCVSPVDCCMLHVACCMLPAGCSVSPVACCNLPTGAPASLHNRAHVRELTLRRYGRGPWWFGSKVVGLGCCTYHVRQPHRIHRSTAVPACSSRRSRPPAPPPRRRCWRT